jgi:hypothetical protein
MSKFLSALQKPLLILLILVTGLLAFPTAGALAAGPDSVGNPPTGQPDPSRLENAWARQQQVFQRQGDRLSRAGELISKVQALIDKANGKGWDTSAVQAALTAFQSAVQDAQTVHAGGTSLIAAHAGFDANGKVTDRTQAIATVKALHQVILDTRAALNGTGRALIQALKDLRLAHKPASTPAPGTP